MDLADVVAAQHALDGLRADVAGVAPDDLALLVRRGVVHDDLHEEAVGLSLGERIRSLLVDRVLRREHEERFGERVRLARGRHLLFLHGFEHRGLRLRRRAVDLVGEDDVREDRSLLEDEVAPRLALADDLRARDVGGHQIGRVLDAREGEVARRRERPDHRGLPETGIALQEGVAAGQHADQQLVDDLALADDLRPDLRAYLVDAFL